MRAKGFVGLGPRRVNRKKTATQPATSDFANNVRQFINGLRSCPGNKLDFFRDHVKLLPPLTHDEAFEILATFPRSDEMFRAYWKLKPRIFTHATMYPKEFLIQQMVRLRPEREVNEIWNGFVHYTFMGQDLLDLLGGKRLSLSGKELAWILTSLDETSYPYIQNLISRGIFFIEGEITDFFYIDYYIRLGFGETNPISNIRLDFITDVILSKYDANTKIHLIKNLLEGRILRDIAYATREQNGYQVDSDRLVFARYQARELEFKGALGSELAGLRRDPGPSFARDVVELAKSTNFSTIRHQITLAAYNALFAAGVDSNIPFDSQTCANYISRSGNCSRSKKTNSRS